jgi:hypothetical protein
MPMMEQQPRVCRIANLESVEAAPGSAVATHIISHSSDGGLVTSDLGAILIDLEAAGVVPAIESQPVLILAQLPFITLEGVLVGAQVARAAGLGQGKRRRAQEKCYRQIPAFLHGGPQSRVPADF